MHTMNRDIKVAFVFALLAVAGVVGIILAGFIRTEAAFVFTGLRNYGLPLCVVAFVLTRTVDRDAATDGYNQAMFTTTVRLVVGTFLVGLVAMILSNLL